MPETSESGKTWWEARLPGHDQDLVDVFMWFGTRDLLLNVCALPRTTNIV